jgi:hypothetical protein
MKPFFHRLKKQIQHTSCYFTLFSSHRWVRREREHTCPSHLNIDDCFYLQPHLDIYDYCYLRPYLDIDDHSNFVEKAKIGDQFNFLDALMARAIQILSSCSSFH